ncbi:hypothetical protein ACPEIF_10850 [Streptomyces sp. NPDC012600]
MPTGQPGRTAPWAKALGAVLLALLGVLVAFFVVGGSGEADRKQEAFESTREKARRFADDVTARRLTPPIARSDLQKAMDAAVGKQYGQLLSAASTDSGTRVVAAFSQMYRRSAPRLGPAEVMTRRCFTIDFDAGGGSPRITAHGADVSCTERAEQIG